MEMGFYRCETCGQIIAIVKKKGCPVMCCGKPMKEIEPGSVDASLEKHVPVVEVDGFVEPAAARLAEGSVIQFERLGYYAKDADSAPGKPVFNRTVTLKDSWSKKNS